MKVFVLPSSTTTCPWLLLWALRCQQRSIPPLPVGPKQAPWWTMITHILRTINDSHTTIYDSSSRWQSRAAWELLMVFKLFELSHVTCRGALFRKWIDVTQVVHDAFSVAGEKAAFENMLKQYPEGIVAVVSDSYVLWPSSILKSLKVSTAQLHWTLAWILQCCRHDTYRYILNSPISSCSSISRLGGGCCAEDIYNACEKLWGTELSLSFIRSGFPLEM